MKSEGTDMDIPAGGANVLQAIRLRSVEDVRRSGGGVGAQCHRSSRVLILSAFPPILASLLEGLLKIDRRAASLYHAIGRYGDGHLEDAAATGNVVEIEIETLMTSGWIAVDTMPDQKKWYNFVYVWKWSPIQLKLYFLNSWIDFTIPGNSGWVSSQWNSSDKIYPSKQPREKHEDDDAHDGVNQQQKLMWNQYQLMGNLDTGVFITNTNI